MNVSDVDHVRVVVEGTPGEGLAAKGTALERRNCVTVEPAYYRKEMGTQPISLMCI